MAQIFDKSLGCLPVTPYLILVTEDTTVTVGEGACTVTITAAEGQRVVWTDSTAKLNLSTDSARYEQLPKSAPLPLGKGGTPLSPDEKTALTNLVGGTVAANGITLAFKLTADQKKLVTLNGLDELNTGGAPINTLNGNVYHGSGSANFTETISGQVYQTSIDAHHVECRWNGALKVHLHADATGNAVLDLNGSRAQTEADALSTQNGVATTWDEWLEQNPDYQQRRVVVFPRLLAPRVPKSTYPFSDPLTINLPNAEYVVLDGLRFYESESYNRDLISGPRIVAPNAKVVLKWNSPNSVLFRPEDYFYGVQQIAYYANHHDLPVAAMGITGYEEFDNLNKDLVIEYGDVAKTTTATQMYSVSTHQNLGYQNDSEKTRNLARIQAHFPRTILLTAPGLKGSVSFYAARVSGTYTVPPMPLNKQSAIHLLTHVGHPRNAAATTPVITMGLASDYFNAEGEMVDPDILAAVDAVSDYWSVVFEKSPCTL